MKPNEQGAAPLPRRGESITLRPQDAKKVAGAPEIAHPDDDEKWELQTAVFTAFLFEMWERVEARNR